MSGNQRYRHLTERQYEQRDRERSPRREGGGYPRRDAGDRFSHDRRSGVARHDVRSQPAPRGTPPQNVPESVPIPPNGQKVLSVQFMPQSSGSRCLVLSNHFKIQSLPTENTKIWVYNLRFEVSMDTIHTGGRKELGPEFKSRILGEWSVDLGLGDSFVFDGVSNGYAAERLIDEGKEGSKVLEVSDRFKVQVTVRNEGNIRVADLVENLSLSERNVDLPVSWLNTLFRDDPSRTYMTKPRGVQYYARDQDSVMPLSSTGNILEAVRGFHQSISSHFGLLTVNVDTSCTAFYTPDLPMLEIFKIIGETADLNFIGNSIESCKIISEYIRGIVIYVSHRGEVGKQKRIKVRGLSQESAQRTTFRRDDASGSSTVTSVADYFRTRYDLLLQYPDLPLLETAVGLLPAEFCFTASGQRYKEVLEGRETADFIKFATARASERASQVLHSVRKLKWHQQAKLAAHGLSVIPSMLELQATRLPIPRPLYCNDRPAEIRNGSWNLRGMQFVKPSAFQACGVAYFPPSHGSRISPQQLDNFTQLMYRSLREYGIRVPSSRPSQLLANAQADIRETISRLVEKTRQESGKAQVLVLCLIHDGGSADLYNAIKGATEVDLGVPCQILKVEKAINNPKGQAQYCANVAMKVNVKIGGYNTVVMDPFFREAPTLIIGGDINHPSPSQLRSENPPPSIMALTGSRDMYASRYSSVAAAVPATNELMTSQENPEVFEQSTSELVNRFQRATKRYPERVIYFRDGVSESQEPSLMDSEVKIMKEQLEKLRPGTKLTVILAVKRHHTRFFEGSQSYGHSNGLRDIAPGTIVESSKRSAFVVGHSAIQGTVRPTHYKILLDENNMSADEFHRLILHGCYSYGRATRAVHIHTAIYYAHEVAERSRARLRVLNDRGDTTFRDVHANLREHTMWFQ